MRLDLRDETGHFEFGDDALARLEAVEPVIARGRRIANGRVRGQDIDLRQTMTQTDLVVVEVVGRRDLDATRAEVRVDMGIRDHRYFTIGERQGEAFANEVTKSLVLRMHGDRCIAQHCLGPRRRDRELAAAIGERIPDMPETAVFLDRQDLEIGQRGLQHRVPVDQALAAVDQALFVQPHECFLHRPRHAGIHRETVAAPVHRSAEPAQLARDGAA